jgi:hypothetical protein
MNYWIDSARESLISTICEGNVVVFNDMEVRVLMASRISPVRRRRSGALGLRSGS